MKTFSKLKIQGIKQQCEVKWGKEIEETTKIQMIGIKVLKSVKV